jgi:hypothetical protein
MATSLQDNVTPQEDFAPQPGMRSSGSRRDNPLRWLAILLVVWCASAIYEGTHLKRGWVPWDAGAYAQSAGRVLDGQLPHRDFTEVYTGGLTYLNAAAIRVFGENLAAERLMMFAFFLAWVPAFYRIASQFCRDWVAGALVLLAVAWSVPNYSEAVPSWYNLFFATWGVAALLAYLKRPHWKWLALAGACGGLSFLAKSVGLCYVSGVLLFFVFREQSITRTAVHAATAEGRALGERKPAMNMSHALWRRLNWYSAFVIASLAIFLALLVRLVSELGGSGETILFIVPSVALSVVLLWNEVELRGARRSGRSSSKRFADLLLMEVPFYAGVAAPILIFLAPYVHAHAMGVLLHDLFGQASTRILMAYDFPDNTVTIIPAIFLAVMLIWGARLRGKARSIVVACAGGLLACGMICAPFNYDAYIGVWAAAYWMIPILAVVGSFLLMHSARFRSSRFADRLPNAAEGERIFLLLAVTALCSLVEFPFSSPIYFCYVAPLAILTLAALLQPFPRVSRAMLAVLYAAFLVFMVFEVTPGFIYLMGFRYGPDAQKVALRLPRAGGLRVDAESAAVYGQLIPLIRAHAGDGDIYAGPDSPEVYFLARYANQTPATYDFLGDAARERQRILRLIANPRVHVMVVNGKPALSALLDETLREEIAQQFPNGEMVGNFEVRWR